MTINLADNDPRIEYTVANGNSQQVFTVPFEFFDDGDLNVYQDGTLKTLTTHYITADDNNVSTPAAHTSGTTGFIHFTAGNIPTASGSDIQIVITRSIDIERTTDFPSSGPFDVASLNTALDKVIAIQADLQDDISRSLRLTDFDLDATLTLPAVNSRKGTVLAFDSSTGAAVAGPTTSGVNTLASIATDVTTLADIEDGTVATDAISDTAAIASDVSTVAGISSNVTTVAGNTTNINTVATDLSGSDDIGTVATNIASVNTVATNIADVVTVANDLNEAISEIETAADDLNEAVSEIDTVAQNIANVNAVGAIDSDVTAVAGITANVTTVAGISADTTTVAGISSDVTTVAGISANTTTVAGISANVTTVAGISSDVTTVAGDSADIATVAGISSDVSAVGAVASNVTTVANNLTNVNAFADTYFVSATAPSSPTLGDLWFDTTANTMKVYGSSGFQNAGSSVNGTAERQDYVVGTSEGTYTGSTTVFPATYDAGFVDVYLNGVKLMPEDFTATNGTDITLDTAAQTNDTVSIVGYGTFNVASLNASNLTSGTIPNARFPSILPAVDGSNLTGLAAFPSGTEMLFHQTSAPTGWTKQTTHDDKAIRIVSGTVGTGGSSAFSTAFATPSVTGTVNVTGEPSTGNLAVSVSGNISNTTLDVNTIPSHGHGYVRPGRISAANAQGGYNIIAYNSGQWSNGTGGVDSTTSNSGNGGAHNHAHNLAGSVSGNLGVGNLGASLSSSTTAINVQYVDFIIAAKD